MYVYLDTHTLCLPHQKCIIYKKELRLNHSIPVDHLKNAKLYPTIWYVLSVIKTNETM